MFKVSDIVMYGSTGLCRIDDIVKGEHEGIETEYYVLHPMDSSNLTIRIPVDNTSIIMRPCLTRDEVLSLIATIPEQKIISIKDKKERNNCFKAVLKSGNNKDLIKVIKTLYLERQAKTAVNQKLSKTDEDIMKSAEKQLHDEFAIALNISPDEVGPYILDYITQYENPM